MLYHLCDISSHSLRGAKIVFFRLCSRSLAPLYPIYQPLIIKRIPTTPTSRTQRIQRSPLRASDLKRPRESRQKLKPEPNRHKHTPAILELHTRPPTHTFANSQQYLQLSDNDFHQIHQTRHKSQAQDPTPSPHMTS